MFAKLHRRLTALCAIFVMAISVQVLLDPSHRTAAPGLDLVAAAANLDDPASAPMSPDDIGLQGEPSAHADHPMIAPDEAVDGFLSTSSPQLTGRADVLRGGVTTGGLDRPPRA